MIGPFLSAPRHSVQDCTIDILTSCLTFLSQVEAKYLSAQTAAIDVHTWVPALLLLVLEILVVNILYDPLAVIPRACVGQLTWGDWEPLAASKDHCTYLKARLASIAHQFESVEVLSSTTETWCQKKKWFAFWLIRTAKFCSMFIGPVNSKGATILCYD